MTSPRTRRPEDEQAAVAEAWRPALQNRKWLEAQVANQGIREIAAGLGCGSSTVYRAIKRHKIDVRAVQREAKVAPFVGRRFGMLTVRAGAEPSRSGNARVLADCDCGGTKTIAIWTLVNRGSGWDHCGCQSQARWSRQGRSNREHGHRRPTPSPTYRSWQAMLDRCYRPRTNGYRSFGGRGIQVCDRWRNSFAAFLDDMGERPEGRTLDRIDVDGDYEQGNCRWATPAEQIANRRRAVWLSEKHWRVIEQVLSEATSSEAQEALRELRRRP